MSGRGRVPDDPRPLLALLACAAGYSLLRFLHHLGPDRVSVLIEPRPSTIAAVAGAALVASGVARYRHIATRRTLASRRAVVVVPADEFDAAPDSVVSFAAQLARSGRRIGGWCDRRASAVRVRLTNDVEGRLVYLLEVPERDMSTLRGALRSYRGVELRDPEEVLGEDGGDGEEEVRLRTELVLARPYVEPLARLPLDPDPLSPFAAALAGLERGDGERAEVCVDLLPIGGSRVLWRRWRMRRQATRRGEAAGSPAGLGGERPGRRTDPGEMAERRDLGRGLDVKLRGGAPLFEAQILLRVRAPGRRRAEGIMRGLLAAFGPFSDRNWLRAAGFNLAGLAFLGADLPGRRRRFDRRVDAGLFRPSSRSVLTTAEIAGLLKAPTVNCRAENVLRSGTLLSPPPDLPEFDPGRGDLIPIGRVAGEHGERIVAVRAADTFFTYVAGRSRWGKTETAITMFAHLVRSGRGGLFLDPHGDALDRIRPYLGVPGVAERVVEIDLGPGGGEDQPCWNLFELSGVDPEARVEAVVDAFATAMGWGERSTRAINLITQTASALAALSAQLPPELAPTVFQIPTLLTDTSWREAVLPFLPESSQSFWRERFPRLSDEAVTPLTNLVDRMGASRRSAALFGASRGTFSLREAMDEELIVLFCPGHGGTRERLTANLVLFDNYHSARSRGELDPDDRKIFVPVLDEAQTYDSDTLAALPEQGAKFGIRAIVINQNPERLRPATLNSLTTNRSHMVVSALNARAAGLVTKEWAGEPRPEAITKLPRYRFVAQVTHHGEMSRPFALGGVRVEDALGAPPAGGLERLEAAIESSGRRRRAADVLAERSTLDSRMIGELPLAPERIGTGVVVRPALRRGEPLGRGPAAGRRVLRGGPVMTMASCHRAARDGLPVGAIDIVVSLIAHRALSAEQIRVMHRPGAGPRRCRAVLARIRDAGLIDHVRIGAGSPQRLWFATEAGIRAALEVGALRRAPRALEARQVAGSLRAHTFAVNEAAISFVEAARERGEDFGPLAWRHEVGHPLTRPARRGRSVIADAVLTYVRADGDKVFVDHRFLELDRATLAVDAMAAELARYADLFRARGAEGEPVWRRRYPAFPSVACVLAGAGRKALVRRRDTALALLRAEPQMTRTPEVEIRVCLLEDLVAHGPFAPIFRSLRDPGRAVDWLGNRDEEGGK